MALEGTEDDTKENQIAQLRTTLADIRYVFRTYGTEHPVETLECIRKLVFDPKIKGVKKSGISKRRV